MVESEIVDGVAVLRLNAPPLNTLTLALLDDLGTRVQQASDDRSITGIVIAGDDHHFSAGADVALFQQIETSDNAVRLCQIFQAAFQGIEDSCKPVVAALAGRVIGGALELAMACHYRVAGSGGRFTMPEVRLGINPGAGGTQRLPRLVGPTAALHMLLTAETVDASRALELGLVDSVCPDDQVVQEACNLARREPEVRRTRARTEKIADSQANERAYHEAQRHVQQARPEIIAPARILEAVRTGLTDSFAAGLEREQQVFDQCMQSLGAQNKIYLFFATSQTSKIPELMDVETAPLERAAVIGMGSMGTGIAHALLLAGVQVEVIDQDAAALDRGVRTIRESLGKRVEQGKLAGQRAEQMLSRLSTSTDWQSVSGANLVVESVYEEVEVKRGVLAQLEAVCSPEAILATNTSTIPLDLLATGMQCPDRLIGMHFFNPAQRMPLVEIVRRETTQRPVLATAIRWARQLRKTPVLVASRPGFLVTRVFVPYVQEAFWLLEEGATAEEIDRAAVKFGFPMGPLVLMDMTGLDILTHAQRVLATSLPRHEMISPIADRLVECGQLGQKSGAGIYAYVSGRREPRPCDNTLEVVAEARRQRGRAVRHMEADEISERLVMRMACEAFYVLEEKVARCASDVDVATVLGTGFPDFRGGVLKYANDLGLDNVLARFDELAEREGERFRASQLLREMKGVS